VGKSRPAASILVPRSSPKAAQGVVVLFMQNHVTRPRVIGGNLAALNALQYM